MVRAGVVEVLAGQDFCTVVGEASTALQVLELVAELKPDLLILDLVMDAGGLAPAVVIDHCREIHPPIKILILSSHTGTASMSALQSVTFEGFVVKTEGIELLPQAVRSLLAGQTWFSHEAAEGILQAQTRSGSVLQSLTRREEQVLRLMWEGRDNGNIAEELQVSKNTVRRYATVLYQKLGVRNRLEAIVLLERELDARI